MKSNGILLLQKCFFFIPNNTTRNMIKYFIEFYRNLIWSAKQKWIKANKRTIEIDLDFCFQLKKAKQTKVRIEIECPSNSIQKASSAADWISNRLFFKMKFLGVCKFRNDCFARNSWLPPLFDIINRLISFRPNLLNGWA